MKEISIWSDVKTSKASPKLDKDINVDVLIIGGGMTGLSTLYHLGKSNLNVCLVEKNLIASGVSSRTTGKLTFLQENIYSKIKSYHGRDKAKLYLDSQIEAINIVKDIISENNIKCNFESASSYVFSNLEEKKLDNEYDLLKEFNVDVKKSNVLPDEVKVNKAIYVNDTYVFHPVKYLHALKEICLKRGASIYENTKIESINKEDEYYVCSSSTYKIKAKYVIVCVHYPYFLLPFLTPLKTHIEKSYIEAYKVNKNFKFSSINISKPTISTRFHEDNKKIYKLFLTNSHNTCVKNNDKKNFNELMCVNKNNPDYLWSNKDIMTNDSLPFIGSLNGEDSLLIGTGYNTWGMTNGSIAGKVLSDIILNKENKYITLFNPLRGLNKGKVINFPLIVGSNALSFIKSKIKKQKDWYSSKVRFEKRNGKNVGVYIDDDGCEHVIYNVCPHFKCGLIFNEIEKTWDCPCHGSRFNMDGKCIEGPSNYDITFNE